MDIEGQVPKGPNHKRNILVILAIAVLGYLGLSGFGAAQCLALGGDVGMSGLAVTCFQDFSGWVPAD